MGEITYLNKAAPKTESLRTTVPQSIIKQLEWFLKAEGGELIIQVKPQKGEVR